MEPLKLVKIEVMETTQSVEVAFFDRIDRVYLTLRESEALIRNLAEANAKVRGLIARDGDVKDR